MESKAHRQVCQIEECAAMADVGLNPTWKGGENLILWLLTTRSEDLCLDYENSYLSSIIYQLV